MQKRWERTRKIVKAASEVGGVPVTTRWDDGHFLDNNWPGGVFHLWGHSWEIEHNKDWGRLERVLSYFANRSDVKYLNNGELPLTA